ARVTARASFHPAGTQQSAPAAAGPAGARGGGAGYPAVGTRNPGMAVPGVEPDLRVAPAQHGQLDELTAILTPAVVARRAMPEAPRHPRGYRGAFVLPAALCGSASADNLIYLPDDAAATLATWQARVVAFARRVPGRFHARTSFGSDGLANGLDLAYECLDPATGAATGTRLTWTPSFAIDRSSWTSGARESELRTPAAPDASAAAGALVDAITTPRAATLVAAMTTVPALAASGRVAALATQLAALRATGDLDPAMLASLRVTFADTLARLADLEPEAFAALAAIL
ncbi:MAG: hypothetical protein K8W52_05770, partial [Deltaproteobacteria bacterium]|nr:hypothetical protein [Deltaproteobacteria bacterium]